MTLPWYRAFSANRSAVRWLARVNTALGAASGRTTVPVRASSTLTELPQLERAVALAAVALAERTPVVMLDQLDSFAIEHDEVAFFTAVLQLAPATTTVVMGTPIPARATSVGSTGSRALVEVDLYSLSPEGLVR